MKKRIFSCLLAVVMLCTMLPQIVFDAGAITITQASQVSGLDFTGSLDLAKKLDAIFAGNASIYSNKSCTNLVNTALGTYSVPNNDVYQYVGAYGKSASNSGTSCWIYANGVYYTLFGEALGNGSPGSNSIKLNLSSGSDTKLTYNNVCAWGVYDGVGAQVRVGSHSLIILSYDSEGMTYLDGNGDGNGLVAIRDVTWQQIKVSSNTNGTVHYIIQPKESYLDSKFPGHNISGGYLVKNTYRTNCIISITSQTSYVKSFPCSEKTDVNSVNVEVASKSDQYQAIGLVENTSGYLWYKVKAKNGSIGYIYAGDTSFISQSTSDVSVSGVAAPTELKLGSSFSIKGTISTQYQTLTKVGAWVNDSGGNFATGNTEDVNTSSYNLLSSNVDYGVKFNNLAIGKYTYHIGATVKTYYASNATTVTSKSETVDLYESAFSVVADTTCSHSYSSSVTLAPTCTTSGVRTYTCSKCGNKYTETIAATGNHNYQNGYCTSCGREDPDALVTLSFNTDGGSLVNSITTTAGSTVTIPTTIPQLYGSNFEGWEASDGTVYQPGDTLALSQNTTLSARWINYWITYEDYNWWQHRMKYPGEGFYFKLYVPESGTYKLESDSSFDTKVTVWDQNGNLCGSDNDSGEGNQFKLTNHYLPDQFYMVYIEPYYNSDIGDLWWSIAKGQAVKYVDQYSGELYCEDFWIQNEIGSNKFDVWVTSYVPSKTGYAFMGWSRDPADTHPVYLPNENFVFSKEDMTNWDTIYLYPVWGDPMHTVVFDANGGSNAPESQSATVNNTIVLPTTIPNRLGYTFKGWSTSSGSTTVSYYPGEAYIAGYAGTKTLYAVWEQAECIRSDYIFDVSISHIGMDMWFEFVPERSTSYQFADLPINDVQPDSKIWIYDSQGMVIASDDDSGEGRMFDLKCNLTAGQTYYIRAGLYSGTGFYTFGIGTGKLVTYNANGGTGAPSSTYVYGVMDDRLSADIPTRSGYTFQGWATSANTTSASYQAGDYFSTGSDVTLYAVWKRDILNGTCGDNLTWTLDANGTLRISGSGEMYDYTGALSPAPWASSKSQIQEIVIDGNVTYIGSYAFCNCHNLTSVTITSSMCGIGEAAYYGCNNLADVYYPGTEDEWSRIVLGSYNTNLTDAIIQYLWGHEHVLVSHAGQAATCTVGGWSDYETCETCDYTTYAALPATGHSYTSVVTAPTCTVTGYTTHTCSCGDSYTDSNVPALGHSLGQWETETIATCSEPGSRRRDCTRCDYHETEEIPATGHSYTSVVTAPTCTAPGYTTHTCSCGISYTDSNVPGLGHSLGQWETVTEATCTEPGSRRRDCTRGDHHETEEIPATGHSYTTAVTAPSCTTQGYTTHTCNACRNTYKDSYVEALGHDWNIGVVTNAPTEQQTGLMTYTCQTCSATKTEVIPVLEHVHRYTDAVTQPTCTAPGYTTHTCSCGDSYTDTQVAALGHAYSKGTCTRCGDLLSVTGVAIKIAPAKTQYDVGQALDTTGLVLTVTYSNGSTQNITQGFTVTGFDSSTAGTQTLTVTYEGFTAKFTVTVNKPAIDENAPQIVLESKKVTMNSTFKVSAKIKNNPGFSYLEVTPVFPPELTLVKVENGEMISDFTKGKQYVWVADEDVTEDGLLLTLTFSVGENVELGNYPVCFTVRTCANYEEELIQIFAISADIEVIDFVYGDATGDGVIDGLDVIRLKKYLANYDYETETSSVEGLPGADANGDGVIDGLDVIRLKKYLANYDYESGESTIVLGPQ